MYAGVDVPAHDYMDSSTEPKLSMFKFDDEDFEEEGLKVIIGDTVVIFYPAKDFMEAVMELM